MSDESVFDDKEVQKFLRDISKNIKKPGNNQMVLDAFSAIVYGDVMDHFKQEMGSKGAWQAWSTMYSRHMQRIGRGNNKKLQFSGRLRQNFRPENRRVTDSSINWFNNAKTRSGYPYAWGHDNGDGKLPQRDFMWLSNKAAERMAEVVWEAILKEEDGK